MTSAAVRTAPRARKPEPCKPYPSGSGRAVLKALICVPLTVAAGGVVLIGLMTGVGWALARATGGQPDARSLARAVPPSSMEWSGRWDPPAGGEAVQQSVAVEIFPRTPTAPGSAGPMFRVAALDPVGGLAAVVPANVPDGRMVTGSLGPSRSRPAFRVASLDGSAVELQSTRVTSKTLPAALPLPSPRPSGAAQGAQPDARASASPSLALPLPRARPRLASLTPLDGLKPEDDTRGRRTAIYDITARIVHLPNGEQLEAHSGLGRYMDDPSSARLKMRGVTPPNTYNLKLRESLFHGVQAIRMTPVNEDRMFGRDGILAHSYMLGPSGQSNGCISFRDYPRFLRAFQRGEVDRIVVVERLAKAPTLARRSTAPEIANIF